MLCEFRYLQSCMQRKPSQKLGTQGSIRHLVWLKEEKGRSANSLGKLWFLVEPIRNLGEYRAITIYKRTCGFYKRTCGLSTGVATSVGSGHTGSGARKLATRSLAESRRSWDLWLKAPRRSHPTTMAYGIFCRLRSKHRRCP